MIQMIYPNVKRSCQAAQFSIAIATTCITTDRHDSYKNSSIRERPIATRCSRSP